MSHRSPWAWIAVLACIVGCEGSPVTPDAGTDAAPPPDGGPPFACDVARPVDAVLDEVVTVMVDTSTTTSRPRDLGLACGNVESEVRWARQEVLEVHVPGEGPVALEIDTRGEGTPLDLNTVVQVRRECSVIPEGIFPATCFDDAQRGEIRSFGAVQAMGGETLYVYVTGFSDPPPEQGAVDEGPIQVDLFARANASPELDAGFVRLAENDVMIGLTGSDADRDLAGFAVAFRGPGGELLDIWGDGEATLSGDVIVVPFTPAPTGTTFDDYLIIRDADLTLGRYLRGVRASTAILRLYDRANAPSAELEVPITEATLVGYQEACDAEHACRNPMQCSGGRCEVFGGAQAVCADATVLAIETPTTTATSVRVSGTTGAGYGYYAASCGGGGTIGAETAYAIDVPDVPVDLIATTNLPGTGTTDTIMSIRRWCPDIGSELACSDDVGSDPQSAIEIRDVASGRYTILVERYGGLGSGTIGHQLEVTLRPVLATGAACDPAGVANRCASGACGTDSLCP